jgi:UDP-N-acetyl-D-galactosamine dehydrogenase
MPSTTTQTDLQNIKIAIIGLGYVGLPLGVEFAKKYRVVGFDTGKKRITELNSGRDHTLTVDEDGLKLATESAKNTAVGLICTDNIKDTSDCNIYIVTVPTPVDKINRPDLSHLYKASETVGKVLKKGDIVIYESTVYPGATEEECVPMLEKVSGLKYNVDFFAGYSPERINPGDKEHTLVKVMKVTSGSTPETAERVDQLYRSIIPAGTHKATSMKVAEAAKVVENSQRDINIAFVNELAKIFHRLDIDTDEVLQAAGTKWNFLKFKPGLVGGHCIGVDPYYLARKAQQVGYHPEIILAGRRLNDGMGEYVAHEVVRLMVRKDIIVKDANILVLGVAFKENCSDVRNSKVVDILNTLKGYNANLTIFDPHAEPADVQHEYGWDSVKTLKAGDKYDAIILAVCHEEFKNLDLAPLSKPNKVIYDVKGILAKDSVDGRL